VRERALGIAAGCTHPTPLGLSADELAEYKKVHGDLRKFMADTKSTKTAASGLSKKKIQSLR
jgi:hypothetical protein